MRGKEEQKLGVFSYVSPEQRIHHDHPLRQLRIMADEALRELKPRFSRLYAKTGRPSIAPEKLLRALLLQALYSVRSERMLMEQLDYSLLFRWLVGLNMDDTIWDVTVFTKNRERLLDGDIAEAFFRALLEQARERRAEPALGRALHRGWNVTGSMGECEELSTQGWEERGSTGRSWQCDRGLPRGEAVELDARIEDGPGCEDGTQRAGQRSEAELQRESAGGEPQGLIVNTEVFKANGTAERDAVLIMLEQNRGTKQVTVDGDKSYDTADFVAECRNLKGTPQVPQNLGRLGGNAIDPRTTQHAGS